MEIWYLLPYKIASGKYNMSLDENLLNLAITSLSNPLLRFYGWEKPTISVGYHQKITDDIDIDRCQKEGIDIVVRPTGGRAILHKDELTYSIVVPQGHYLSQLSLLESYKRINSAISLGLKKIGIPCEISLGEKEISFLKNPSCFSSTSKYELSYNGRKVVGSAQRRLKGGFLQQGSILLDDGYLMLERFIRSPKNSNLQQKSISIRNVLGYLPPIENLINAIIDGFKEEFGICFRQVAIDEKGRIYEPCEEYSR